jgi:hypothetical protein
VYSVLVLWVLAVPIALVVLLYRLHKRNALRQPETLRRWGFLYATYGPRFFWFEGFVLLRRVLISGLAVLLIRDPQGRGAGLAVALIGFLIVQLSLSPYAHRTPNTFDVAALTSLLLITVIASGHSVLTDAEYPIVVQVSASLIVFTVALALLFGIFQGRWRRAPKMMALTTWLTAQRDACLHCICCDAQGSAGSAHYAADDSSLLDIYTLRSEDLDPSAPSSLTVPLSAFDNVNGANQLDQPTAYSEHTHSLASVSQGDAYEHPDQRANRMPLLSQPLLSDASP